MLTETEQMLKEFNFLAVGEQNPVIKQVKGILSNTKPNPKRQFIAEGLFFFKRILEYGSPVDCVILCPEYLKTAEALSAAREMSHRCRELYSVSAKTYDKISERDKPDGLTAVARLPMPDISGFHTSDNSIILVLDGVEIPGNAGTMIRMADGAGLDAVFMCNRRVRMCHPKLIRGSQGAVLTVPVYEFADTKECADWLIGNGFNIYLADTRAPRHYFDEPFGHKTAIIMGNERYGITRDWYAFPHIMISIPMLGSMDSLNVGVAATVLCYEASIKNKLNGRKQ